VNESGRKPSRSGGQRRSNQPNSPRNERPRAARSGWDALASWYDGWMGKGGSKHHQRLAIPQATALLDLKPGETLLDIGCGQGVFAPFAKQAGATYTGMDVSSRLLDMARQYHGKDGTFIEADACKIELSSGLRGGTFDAALFLLSIQDINPLDAAIRGAAFVLKPGGKLVMVMTHPAFRIPRQSGWGFDEGRKLTYRRIDRYLTPLNVPLKPYPGQSGVSISFHRAISTYVTELADHGLMIDALREIPSFKADDPESNNPAEKEIPLFLALRARKVRLD
jgi:ubiquinone/menaquinone biosynthesis C-methylase UbiE